MATVQERLAKLKAIGAQQDQEKGRDVASRLAKLKEIGARQEAAAQQETGPLGLSLPTLGNAVKQHNSQALSSSSPLIQSKNTVTMPNPLEMIRNRTTTAPVNAEGIQQTQGTQQTKAEQIDALLKREKELKSEQKYYQRGGKAATEEQKASRMAALNAELTVVQSKLKELGVEDFSLAKLAAGAVEKGLGAAGLGVAKAAAWAEDLALAPFELIAGQKLGELSDTAPLNRYAESLGKEYQAILDRYAGNTERGGDAAQLADMLGTDTVAAVPNAVLSMLTGGGSTLAQTTTGLAQAASAALSPGLVSTVTDAVRSMASNPAFWSSFTQVVGENYEDAIEDQRQRGETDETKIRTKAALYSVCNGLANAAVEVGGGIETLPGELQKNGSALKAWIDGMVDEGKEEVVQGIVERALQGMYGKENTLVSTKDQDAILNPLTAAKEFAGGAVVGGLLGGAEIGANSAMNAAYNAGERRTNQNQTQKQGQVPAPPKAENGQIGADVGQETGQTAGPVMPPTSSAVEDTGATQIQQQTNAGTIAVTAEDQVRGVLDAALESGKGKTTAENVAGELERLGEKTGNGAELAKTLRGLLNEREYVFDRDGNIVKRSPYDVHIDERTGEDLSSRRVNAFQFDHPELHQYFADAAQAMQYDLSGTVQGERFPVYGADGYQTGYTGTERYTTQQVAAAKDDFGLSYADISRALQNIVEDNGQENYAAAKKVETVLDDMLTNGYTDIDGNRVPPNEGYIAAKEKVLPQSVQQARAVQAAEDNEGLPLFSGTEIRDGYTETLKGAETHGREAAGAGPLPAETGGNNAAENGAEPAGAYAGGQERVAGARAGGQGGQLDGGAEKRQYANRWREAAEIKNHVDALQVKEQSPQEIGVSVGNDQRTLKQVPREAYTQAMEEAERRYAERGYRTVYFTGLMNVNTPRGEIEANGCIDGDNIFIKADSRRFSPEQIGDHEIFHSIVQDDPGLVSKLRDEIVESFGQEELDRVMEKYIKAYRGVYGEVTEDGGMSDDEAMKIMEEIFADAYGKKNAFSAGAVRYTDNVRSITEQRNGTPGRQNAAAVDRKTGPPAGIDSKGRQLTKEQNEYFKNSKVRDENGDLKVMYHGTSRYGFTVFDVYNGKFGLFGKGSYFTDSKSVAESYTDKGNGPQKGVYEVYLNIENPINMDAPADVSAWEEGNKDVDFSGCQTNEDCFRALSDYCQDEQMVDWEAEELITDTIIGMGYDGITHIGGGRVSKDGERHQVYIAFEPEQIKRVDNKAPSKTTDIRYSFGGRNANRADSEGLAEAERLEMQNVDPEEIRQQTGWFRGSDGLWRFEIDDSGMEYRGSGGATVGDLITHEELFRNYPQLRKMPVSFQDLGRNVDGRFTGDEIILDNSMRDAPESTLIHEIQHAIQETEGFAKGSNVGYWDNRIKKGYDSRTKAQKEELANLRERYGDIRENEPEFFQDMLELNGMAPDVPRGAFDPETMEQIEEDPPEWQRYDELREQLEEKYGWDRVWDFTDLLYRLQQAELQEGRSATDLYYDTAGEIEARDAQDRLRMTEDERRNTPPERGNVDTVFVEDDGVDSFSEEGYDVEKDGLAKWTEQRIDQLYDEYASSSMNYAKAYATFISPEDFLSLTTANLGRIEAESRPLNLPELAGYRQPIYLVYDPDEPGVVAGHEGRHRMVAMRDASVKRVPIAVEFWGEEGKYRRQPLAELHVTGQRFGSGDAPGDVILKDLVPISRAYRGEIEKKFGSTGEEKIRFSMDEPVEETEDLLALHNLTEKNLLDSLDLGGLPMPSIAVVKADTGHAKYGPISLVFSKDTIDPELIRSNKLYSGDAWTPTAPHIEYKASTKKVQEIRDKVYKLVGGYEVASQIQHTGLDTDNMEDTLNRNGGDAAGAYKYNDTLKYAFLRESDPSYTAPTKTQSLGRQSGFDDSIIQETVSRYGETGLEEMLNGGYRHLEEHPEIEEELLDIINGYYSRKLESAGKGALKRRLVDKLGFAKFDGIIRDAYRYATEGEKAVVDTQELRKDLNELVDETAYKEWLDELFNGVEEKRGIRNEKDLFAPSGNRRSFDALHYEVTLENIVKAMKSSRQKGDAAFGGATGIWGVATKDYGSIGEMKADSGRLQNIPEEEYDAMRDQYSQRLAEIADSIKDPRERNRFIAVDNAAEAIVDTLRTKKTAAAIDRELRTYTGMNIHADTAQEILDLVRDIRSMPTGYFEAKPQRAVGFDEVLAAVIPSDSSEKLTNALEGKGVNVLTYENGNEADRLEKINSIENVRFSVGEDETPAQMQFRRVHALEEEQTPAQKQDQNGEDLYRPEGMSDQQYDFLNKQWKEAQEQRKATEEARDHVLGNESKDEFTGTPSIQKLGIKIEGSVGLYGNTESLLARERAARSIEKKIEAAEKRIGPTEKEKSFASQLAAGVYDERDIPDTVDLDKVSELADYYAAKESFSEKPLVRQRGDIRAAVADVMRELFQDGENVKTSSAVVLNYRTPERNMRHIFGNERGAAINRFIFEPVQTNEAERYRWMNTMFDKVRGIEGRDGKKSELNKTERFLTQLALEGKTAETLLDGAERTLEIKKAAEEIEKGMGPRKAARKYDLDQNERVLAETVAKYEKAQKALEQGKADAAKIDNAVRKFREMYNDLYDAINDFLVAHGYEPIGFIKDYAPHFQSDDVLGKLQSAMQALGVLEGAGELPASVAGRTADFKPGKRFDPHFLERVGDSTQYDAYEGFEQYIKYVSDIFYHTDDIMKVREAANYFRQTYAPENIKDELDRLRELRKSQTEEKANYLRDHNVVSQTTVLTDTDVEIQMEKHLDELYAQVKNTGKFSELVKWLDNYANILAGKQSMADRGQESALGRESLNWSNKLLSFFGGAQVAGNLSSAINQIAQVPLIVGELGPIRSAMATGSVAKTHIQNAIADISNGKVQKAGWIQESDFLTGKEGVRYLTETLREKAKTALFTPAEIMDGTVAAIAVRGKYLQEIQNGKSHKEAMKAADAFGKSVMGSRMKGSKPVAFQSKNTLQQWINIFQVEAINTWEHVGQDVFGPEIENLAKEKGVGKAKAAIAIAKMLAGIVLSAFAINRITEELYGGTPAPFDLLGMLANYGAAGYGLTTNQYVKTVLDNGWEKLTGERLFDTDAQALGGDFDQNEALEDTAGNVMNDVPFARNISGIMGWGDETLPLPDAAGVLDDTKKAAEENGWITLPTLGTFLLRGAEELMPGGRQLTKSLQGYDIISKGGKYKGDEDEQRLQYPVEDNFWTALQAMMFGGNALEEQRSFYASGAGGLTAKQTQLYQALVDDGVTRREAYDAIQGYRALETDEMDSYETGKAKRDYISGLDLTDQQKLELYRGLTNAESRSDRFQTLMDAGMTWDQVMDAYDKYEEMNADEELNANERATELAKWVDLQEYTKSQKESIKEQFAYWNNVRAEASSYEKFAGAAGLDPDTAYDIQDTLRELEPEEGKQNVTSGQKIMAIAEMPYEDDVKSAALEQVMTEKQYASYQEALDAGISTYYYCTFITEAAGLEADKDKNGNSISGSKKKKVLAAIDELPLTRAQKDLLYYQQGYAKSEIGFAPWR